MIREMRQVKWYYYLSKQALGYVVYRTVLQYYSGETDEDAYDMRKSLSRDRDKKSMVPLSKGYVHMDELEY